MKILTLALTALLVCTIAQAGEDGFFAYEFQGYTDTPMIPDSEFRVHQKGRSQPPRVVPGGIDSMASMPAPSDATILFDGGSLDAFGETTWPVQDGRLVAGTGSLITRQAFGDCQLHVEWRSPDPPRGKPVNMGNSGLYIMQRYEVQIFDSFSCKIYADGSAAAIYGQSPPLVNACRRPGEWQSYDIIFTAPEFNEGKLVEEARITVMHNGVLVQNNTRLVGPTGHRTTQPYKPHGKSPLSIQGHNSPVEFRNIWIRELQ